MPISWVRARRSGVRSGGTRARRAWLTAVLLLSAAASRHPALAVDSPDTLPDVEVDLSGRLFKQVLPFDVDFQTHGSVPATTQRVEVQYIGHSRSFRVKQDQADDCIVAAVPLNANAPAPSPPPPECFEQTSAGEVEFPCQWQPGASGPIFWKQENPPAATATPPPQTFRVAVPPLEAKTHYVFRFEVQRALTETDLQQFRSRARAVLDPLLRGIQSDNPSPADNARLRGELVHALQVVACPGLHIVGSNLFNLRIPYDELEDQFKLRFNELIGDVMDTQGNIGDLIQARSLEQPNLEHRLRLIADSQALDKLIRALRAKAASGQPNAGLVQEFLDRHQDALGLADLNPTQVANLSLGLAADPPSPAPRFLDTIDPAVAGQFAAGYSATEKRLSDLEQWLGTLVQGGNRHLLDEAVAAGQSDATGQGLTAGDVTALQALLRQVGEARQKAHSLADFARQVQTNQQDRGKALDEIARVVEVQARAAGLILDASTLGSFKTQQKWYISADFGLAAGPEVDKVIPYVGTNIYTRPVNKDAPLSEKGGWRRRFAFTLGLTVKSIADSNPQTRNDLFDNNSLLVGAGWRVTDSGRFSLGALVFYEKDPNPLLNRESLTYSPYVSLSFDWDVLGFFRNFSGIFPGGGSQP